MSKTLYWRELIGHAVEFTRVQTDDDILQDLLSNTGEYGVLYRSEGLDRNYEFKPTDFETINRIDRGDGSPVHMERGAGTWLGHRGYEVRWIVVPRNIFNQTQTTGNAAMTTTTTTTNSAPANRRNVRIELIDNDAGLDVQHSLVCAFGNIMTEDDDATTIQQLIMDKDIAGKLDAHNELRKSQVNLDILQRTGQTVHLNPVKLKQLTWVIK